MKISKRIDAEACRMVRRFVAERVRRIKSIDKKTAALQRAAEKLQTQRQQIQTDESDGFRFILAPLGFEDAFGPSLNINTLTGECSWDDGKPDPEVEKAKNEKIIGESARSLAKGKRHVDAEIIPLEAANKNGD